MYYFDRVDTLGQVIYIQVDLSKWFYLNFTGIYFSIFFHAWGI